MLIILINIIISINLYITSLKESITFATSFPFSPLLFMAIPNNIEITISGVEEGITKVDIPETIEGKTVTTIGQQAFLYRNDIKKDLIQHVDTYKEDMRQVIEELDRVTTDNAIIIFVVGDKKIGKNIINGGEFFNSIKEASYIEERSYSGSSSQVFDVLNKTNRKEQIVVWNKEKGKVVKYGRKEA